MFLQIQMKNSLDLLKMFNNHYERNHGLIENVEMQSFTWQNGPIVNTTVKKMKEILNL